MKRFYLGLLVFLLVVMGIAAQDEGEATPEATAEPILTRDSLPVESEFQLVSYATGFQFPLFVTHAGDESDRLFVVEQSGRIWILQDGELLNTPFIDLSGVVNQRVLSGYSEGGLLGLAFHPEYDETGLFYVNYTDVNGTSQVAQYRVSEDDPNLADSESGRILMTIGQPYPNHNGGHMAFGPDDYLYISFGDGGSADDPQRNGQNSSTLLGTILRIDVESDDPLQPYGIPDDNPFFSNPNLAPEIWVWGLRNVWRFSFDAATGDMYLADVGQNQFEEVNFQPAESDGGQNYGWPAYEGESRYLRVEAASDVTMPIATYNHQVGCSITGGYVYRGEEIPALAGTYLYSDYCSGRLWGAYRNADGVWQSGQITNTGRQISSFGQDENGELYLVDYAGEILRLAPIE